MAVKVSEREYLTPPAVARKLGIDPERVRRWIESGKLVGINIGEGEVRPRWRIHPDALEAFLAARSSRPSVKQVRRRRAAYVPKHF